MTGFGDLSNVAPHRLWAGVHARAVESSRMTLAMVELEPNVLVPEHAHENEQVGILISGSLRFRIADEIRELEPGGSWSIPPHVPHEVEVGPLGAVLVESFAPCRSDWARLERAEPSVPRWGV